MELATIYKNYNKRRKYDKISIIIKVVGQILNYLRCNMEIKVADKGLINDYIKFCNEVYKNNQYYRDGMSASLKSILKGSAEICKSSIIRPIMVLDSGKIVAVCTFAIVDRMKDILQLAYFEALDNQERALDKIIEYGKKLAKNHGINRILVGLNFHVNYGLGLLADNYDSIQSFGSSYNHPYYIDYFKRYSSEEINLVSYLADMNSFEFNIKDKLMNRIMDKYLVRKANFKDIKGEAEIYTNLNNRAFKNHRFYYERRINEDLELFNDFKLFLKEENLLFVEYEGKAIGFMLWYPDFNELIEPGEKLGLKTLIKSKILHNRIKKFKIVELGVIPEFHKKGASIALFNYCKQLIKDRYKLCESGWILEDNFDSRGFGVKWANKEYKHYKVFLIDI